MWSIRILSGQNAGQIFELKLGKTTIGRSAHCDIKISSVGISKEHCEIHAYKDKVIVVDLKSSNGTFVNGVKIQNTLINLGDKLSVFDVMLDIIPTAELKPKVKPRMQNPADDQIHHESAAVLKINTTKPQQVPQNYTMENGSAALQLAPQYQNKSQNQFQPQGQMDQMAYLNQPLTDPSAQNINSQPPVAPTKTLAEKINHYIDHAFMPVFYRLAVIFPFKHVLLGLILLMIVSVTICSVFPMTTIIKESNFIEASKRAKSVARALARINEQALLAGQINNLNVQEALKEDGIKEALIIQQSDGAIVAPSEKAGRESTKPFLIQARKETRATAVSIDSNTIAATHPIGVYDPATGESSIKYHAVVYADVSSLNVDDGRIVSLFMQTLIISSLFGLLLYFIFSRLIEYPLKELNLQVDKSLREKTDHTIVAFDYPELQKTVANVNLILNRMWNGLSESETIKPQQNKDVELTNLTEILTQPAVVISQSSLITACNTQFELLLNTSKDQILQKHFDELPDNSLPQMLHILIGRAKQSVYEKHSDRMPFSQFECEINLQTLLDSQGNPEFYFITLAKVDAV